MNDRLSQEGYDVFRDKQPHGISCGFVYQIIKGG